MAVATKTLQNQDRELVLSELQRIRRMNDEDSALTVEALVRRLDSDNHAIGIVDVRRALDGLRREGLVRELQSDPGQPSRFCVNRKKHLAAA